MPDGEVEHVCSRMPSEGVWIARTGCGVHLPQGAWALVVERRATEEDLETDHHVEQCGDLIWSTTVAVTHCPFCGIRLAVADLPAGQPAGRRHVDASRWRSRVL